MFGTRKRAHLRGEPKDAEDLPRIAGKPQLLPVLNQEVSERTEDAVAMQTTRGILVRKQQKITGRPVTPLHKGHVGLLAYGGQPSGSAPNVVSSPHPLTTPGPTCDETVPCEPDDHL